MVKPFHRLPHEIEISGNLDLKFFAHSRVHVQRAPRRDLERRPLAPRLVLGLFLVWLNWAIQTQMRRRVIRSTLVRPSLDPVAKHVPSPFNDTSTRIPSWTWRPMSSDLSLVVVERFNSWSTPLARELWPWTPVLHLANKPKQHRFVHVHQRVTIERTRTLTSTLENRSNRRGSLDQEKLFKRFGTIIELRLSTHSKLYLLARWSAVDWSSWRTRVLISFRIAKVHLLNRKALIIIIFLSLSRH